MTGSIIILLLLLLLSGLFSATETAFTSLSFLQIQKLEQEKGKRGKLIKYLSGKPDILLTTILLGNNLVNIVTTTYAAHLTTAYFGSAALSIMTVILTIIVLIFAEVTPKQIAIIRNEPMALITVYPILWLSMVLRPFVLFINLFSTLITKIFAGKKRNHISLDGILHMVNVAGDMGVVEEYEQKMVKSVFRFNDVQVQAILTHRKDVFSLETTASIKDALPQIQKNGFSRIPVYKKNPENIVGIILAKDILQLALESKHDMLLKEIMIEPLFIPETRPIKDLFNLFKREKLNMAVALDEYGGLAGIVTQEDLVEEVIGELYDEDEEKEVENIITLDEHTQRIQGDTPLYLIKDELDIDLPHSPYVQTLGGYVTEITGAIPEEGKILEIPQGTLTVEKVADNRVVSLIFKRIENPEQDSQRDPA